jgi:phage-related protein
VAGLLGSIGDLFFSIIAEDRTKQGVDSAKTTVKSGAQDIEKTLTDLKAKIAEATKTVDTAAVDDEIIERQKRKAFESAVASREQALGLRQVEQAAGGAGGKLAGVGGAASLAAGAIGGLVASVGMFALNFLAQIPGMIMDAFTGLANKFMELETRAWRVGINFGTQADFIIGKAGEIRTALDDLVDDDALVDSMNTVGRSFLNMGFGTKELGDLTQVSAAMGIISGQGTDAVMQAIQGAMVTGRTNPLKEMGFKVPEIDASASDAEKATTIYNALVAQMPQLTEQAKTFGDTTEGSMMKMSNSLGDLFELLSQAMNFMQPIYDFISSVVDGALPYLEQYMAAFSLAFGQFSQYVSNLIPLTAIFDVLKAYLGFCFEQAMKLFEALFYVYQSLDTIAKAVLGIMAPVFKFLGDLLGWLWGVFKGIFGAIYDVVLWFAKAFAVVAGMISDNTRGMGEKVADILKLLITAFIDAGQKIISIVGDLAKALIDLGASMGNGLANALIKGVNWGLQKVADGINWFVDRLPQKLRETFNIGYVSAPTIGEIKIDTSGAKKLVDDVTGGVNKWIDEMQAKYGLNVSLEELAKKYGVDLNKFQAALKESVGPGSPMLDPSTGLPALTTTMQQLKDTVATKDMASKMQLEVNISQVFEGEYDQATREKVGREVQQAIFDALRNGGVPV